MTAKVPKVKMRVPVEDVVRCRRMRMLTLAQAERYCARVGMHPRHVWGDWYTALCAVLHPVNVAEVLADDVARAIGGCELVAAWLAVRSLGAWRQFASGAAA